jgi:hypothetical protein
MEGFIFVETIDDSSTIFELLLVACNQVDQMSLWKIAQNFAQPNFLSKLCTKILPWKKVAQ